MKKFFELAAEAVWWTLGATLLFAFFYFLLGFDLTVLGANELGANELGANEQRS